MGLHIQFQKWKRRAKTAQFDLWYVKRTKRMENGPLRPNASTCRPSPYSRVDETSFSSHWPHLPNG